MSQVTHPIVSLPSEVRSRRAVALAGLLALVATVAVVLVLVLGGGSTESQPTVGAAQSPSLRTDGGPEESNVAAAIGSRASAGPDESRIAASISGR